MEVDATKHQSVEKAADEFEDDIIGRETLQNISNANAFNGWMYAQIKPFIKGKVLEIGSGIGNISQYVVEQKNEVVLSDFNPHYLKLLTEKFGCNENFLGAHKIDLVNKAFETEYERFLGSFDTIIALNVVEHIRDDSEAIQNCKKLLRKDGHLVVLVPCYSFLFSKMDEKLGHYKRYTRRELLHLTQSAGFHTEHSQYFNFAGIFAWFISAKLLRTEQIGENNMKLFNALVPIFKLADLVIGKSMGLSTIVVGKV